MELGDKTPAFNKADVTCSLSRGWGWEGPSKVTVVPGGSPRMLKPIPFHVPCFTEMKPLSNT